MQTLTEIRQLLDERGLKPKHRLGQNFLHDKNQLNKLLDAADIRVGDVVLEVGPGTGTLTSALLERGAEVIACELDGDMAGIIEQVFAETISASRDVHVAGTTKSVDRGSPPDVRGGSLTLIRGDVLDKGRRLNPQVIEALGDRAFKLVANLPYQIASALMTTLLIDHPPTSTTNTLMPLIADGGATPQAVDRGQAAAVIMPLAASRRGCTGQFVTIQKEVAERLLAKPGTKSYGPLSIIVQAFAEVSKIGVLSPSCFWPQPDVTSAMVAILPHHDVGWVERIAGGDERNPPHELQAEQRREFAQFVVELFTKRRKQVGTIFGRPPKFGEWPQGVTPDLRPEALSVEQVIALWQADRGGGQN